MRSHLATGVLVCLLVSSPVALGGSAPRDREKERPKTSQGIRHIIRALGDLLSPPKP
jgi:hypothetical protein